MATQRLAAREARTLAIFGTGVQARAHAEALLLVASVRARAGRRPRDGAGVCGLGADGIRCDRERRRRHDGGARGRCDRHCDARDRAACSTARWVRPGAFIAAVGSSKPAARELDDALLARAELIVVEWLPAAQAEAGEFVRAAPGTIDPARVTELGKLLVRGTAYDRRAGDIVVYKSVGIGLEDVALAHLVYQRCA